MWFWSTIVIMILRGLIRLRLLLTRSWEDNVHPSSSSTASAYRWVSAVWTVFASLSTFRKPPARHSVWFLAAIEDPVFRNRRCVLFTKRRWLVSCRRFIRAHYNLPSAKPPLVRCCNHLQAKGSLEKYPY